MSRGRGKTEEGAPKVPAYIVTFSDMVTLLLTFFVMLLSLAQVQDPELFNIGRDAFIKYLRGVGIGMLLGKKVKPDFGKPKFKYYISEPDKSLAIRSIDAKEEKVRRIYKKVSQSMNATPSQIVAKTTKFSVTNIHFLPGDTTLNESAKRFLTQFVLDLQQQPATEAVRLYVLGLANAETTEKQQWLFSARRAQVVANFLKEDLLSSQLNWPVYSWGAGPGGHWVGRDSPISRQSQILIAVLRGND